jgi:hypothetical protein
MVGEQGEQSCVRLTRFSLFASGKGTICMLSWVVCDAILECGGLRTICMPMWSACNEFAMEELEDSRTRFSLTDKLEWTLTVSVW